MRKSFLILLMAFLALLVTGTVYAQQADDQQTSSRGATEGAEATPAAVVRIVEEKEKLTEPKKGKSRLERVLESKEVGELNLGNFLQVAIREAVKKGVPVNTIVLMLLFPLVAAIIAAARHIVGLKGFGIFTPAVISVAFLSTGVGVGVLLFLGIIAVATLGRMVIRKMRLPSLPRLALLLWFVSLGVLGLILASPWLNLNSLITINIFPILLLVLLAETFIRVQITRSFREAMRQTFQTFVLALISFLVMSTEMLQEWVLLNPELAVVMIAGLDIVIAKYGGLRLMEMWRFRKIIK